jgi:hypothetical protein
MTKAAFNQISRTDLVKNEELLKKGQGGKKHLIHNKKNEG